MVMLLLLIFLMILLLWNGLNQVKLTLIHKFTLSLTLH